MLDLTPSDHLSADVSDVNLEKLNDRLEATRNIYL